MGRITSRVARMTAVCAVTAALTVGMAGTAAADGEPNTMTCVYTGAWIDAPTNVPVAGHVVWVADAHLWDPAAGRWQSFVRQELTNVATQQGITPGPWADADGTPTWVINVGIPVGSGPVELAVYNRFYSTDTGQWVEGFWTTSTLTGGQSCVLDGGPIVV